MALLNSANNLSDVGSKATSRANLEVYSWSEVYPIGQTYSKPEVDALLVTSGSAQTLRLAGVASDFNNWYSLGSIDLPDGTYSALNFQVRIDVSRGTNWGSSNTTDCYFYDVRLTRSGAVQGDTMTMEITGPKAGLLRGRVYGTKTFELQVATDRVVTDGYIYTLAYIAGKKAVWDATTWIDLNTRVPGLTTPGVVYNAVTSAGSGRTAHFKQITQFGSKVVDESKVVSLGMGLGGSTTLSGNLAINLNYQPMANYTSGSDDDLLAVYNNTLGVYQKITKGDLIPDAAGIRLKGSVALAANGSTGVITSDPLNTSISAGVAPNTSGSADPARGYSFYITNSSPVTSTITGTSETFSLADQVFWSGTAWMRLPSFGGIMVSTFKGRSGAVLPQSGDYSATQITGAVAGTLTNQNVQQALDAKPNKSQTDTVSGAWTFSQQVLGSQGFTATNPNATAVSVALNWSGDVPRLRVSGTGTGNVSPLNIVGISDALRMSIAATESYIGPSSYKIQHAGNSNLSTVDWTMQNAILTGNATLNNNKYLMGKNTTGAVKNLIGMDTANRVNVGVTDSGLTLEAAGWDAKVTNGTTAYQILHDGNISAKGYAIKSANETITGSWTFTDSITHANNKALKGTAKGTKLPLNNKYDLIKMDNDDDILVGTDTARLGFFSNDPANLWLVSEVGNPARQYKIYNQGFKPTAADVGALALTATSVNSSKLEGLTKAQVVAEARSGYLPTSGKAVDSELLDGYDLSDVLPFVSKRDFVNGTLVTTSIDYSQTNGSSFYVEVKGNSYGSGPNYGTFDTAFQGYINSNTIINYAGNYTGSPVTPIIAMNVGGKLCFWWSRQSYWQGFMVTCYDTSANVNGSPRNTVVSITDVAEPAGTKKVNMANNIFKTYTAAAKPTAAELSVLPDSTPYVGIDSAGSALYPRMTFMNNTGNASVWLRASTDSGGLLPYSNGNSYLGTSTWNWKEVWGVAVYDAGSRVFSPANKPTATDVGLSALSVDGNKRLVIGTTFGNTLIGMLNATWAHYDTAATSGHYFYKNMQVAGSVTAASFIGKSTDSEALDGIDSLGFARAGRGSLDTGAGNWTTAEFITYLNGLDAFSNGQWSMKGSWSYGANRYITDTGIGVIQLAGATIEVFGNTGAYHIRVTTSPTVSGGGAVPNAVFLYKNHGPTYNPHWSRIFTSDDDVKDVIGAMPITGGTATGQISAIGTGNTYNAGAFQAYGNGAANTVFPTIGFHQPGLYAGSIRLVAAGIFNFYDTGSSALGTINAGSLNGSFAGTIANYLSTNTNGSIVVNNTNARSAGMYGLYDSTKTAHIWSMGTAYRLPDDGSNFGSLFGLAYKHTNNATGGTMAGDHQVVWCTNGVPGAALGGSGLWANNTVTIGSGAGSKMFIADSTDGWSYLSLRKSGATVWDIAQHNGGRLEFRSAGSDATAEISTTAVYAKEYRGKGNVAGTGEAIYAPAGIYVPRGHAWLYGGITTNNNSIAAGTGTITCGALNASGNIGLAQNSFVEFAGNSSWGGVLRVGGNGRSSAASPLNASVAASNGNLHLDSGSDKETLLNFYSGTSGIKFGNGAQGIVGSVSSVGNLVMNGSVAANGGLSQDGNVILNGSDTWLRTTGDTGWHSSSHGGGIHMTDATWVRIYGNKKFYVAGSEPNTIFSGGGVLLGDGAIAKTGFAVTGAYTPTAFQGVFSMGVAYQLPADGSTSGNLYGIAWTHSNNTNGNGRKISGHHACFMSNGVTRSAIGDHIWTSGTMYEGGVALSDRYQAKGSFAGSTHSHVTQTESRSVLYNNATSGGQLYGAFTLSQSFYDFEEIWVVFGDASLKHMQIWTRESLELMRASFSGGSNGFAFVTSSDWRCWGRFSADRRTFTPISTNAGIFQIIGVNKSWS